MRNYTIIGGGSWGTALACLVARAIGRSVLYTIEENRATEINNKHKNSKYLGDVKLPPSLVASTDFTEVANADAIIIATPSYAFEEILAKLKNANIKETTTILIASKGLCKNPVQLFSDKIESELKNPYCFISGPNFAKEVAEGKFASIVISSKNLELATKIASELRSKNLEISTSDDVITVQIASIVKNIIAIKSGVMQASGAGENEKAWLISQGLTEIAAIAKELGGRPESLTLPSVIGDLVLTACSTTSRNTKFGYEFAKSEFKKDFITSHPELVEGIDGARNLKIFLKGKGLNLPALESVMNLV